MNLEADSTNEQSGDPGDYTSLHEGTFSTVKLESDDNEHTGHRGEACMVAVKVELEDTDEDWQVKWPATDGDITQKGQNVQWDSVNDNPLLVEREDRLPPGLPPSSPPMPVLLTQAQPTLPTQPTPVPRPPPTTPRACCSSAIERLEERVCRLESVMDKQGAYIRQLEEQLTSIRSTKATKVKATPQYRVTDGLVQLGDDPGSSVRVPEPTYLSAFFKSTTAKEFVVKLMPHVLSEELMASSNFHGGCVFTGTTWLQKAPLHGHPSFRAIISQAEMDFPGCFASREERCSLRDAVNGKCRKVAQKKRCRAR